MAFPLVKWVYNWMGNQFFFREGQLAEIPSVTGFHQGDVLGSWCYIMTIQSLLLGLANHLLLTFPAYSMDQIRAMIFFFVDDGNLCGPHEVIVEAVRYIKAHGPEYGYNIKPSKGGYLVGKCATAEEALARYTTLTSEAGGVALGTHTVHLHPDNIEEAVTYDLDLPLKYQQEDLSTPQQRSQAYGVKILGAYIGSDQFVNRELDKVLNNWQHTAECLISFPFVQQRMLLFRYCFNMKPVYLMRTMTWNYSARLVDEYRKLQKRILESMFVQQLDDDMLELLCMPIDEGGLGILNFLDVQRVAHSASVFGFQDLRSAYVAYLDQIADYDGARSPFMRILHQELVLLREYLELGEDATDEEIATELGQIAKESRRKGGTFQHELYLRKNAQRKQDIGQMLSTDRMKSYHFATLKNDTAGKWLQAFPRYKNMEISNTDYTAALCFRYMLNQPLIHERDHCPLCSKQTNRIDRTGHHFVSGCMREVEGINGTAMKAQRHANHNYIRQALYLCCKHAIAFAQEEPANLFPQIQEELRPDLVTAFKVKDETVTFALDVTLVCPFTGVQSGRLTLPINDNVDANQCDVHADARAQLKRDKYEAHCTARNIRFVPFVVYTTGKIHKSGVKFLKSLAAHAAEQRKIPEGTLLRYYCKMISVCLVQRIGYTIHTRAMACTTRNFRIRDVLRNGNEMALRLGGSQVSVRRYRA